MATSVEVKVLVLVEDGYDEEKILRETRRSIEESFDERGVPEGAVMVTVV